MADDNDKLLGILEQRYAELDDQSLKTYRHVSGKADTQQPIGTELGGTSGVLWKLCYAIVATLACLANVFVKRYVIYRHRNVNLWAGPSSEMK